MLKAVSNIVSILFHPLFMVVYLYGILILANPYGFGTGDLSRSRLAFVSVFSLSVFFPAVAIAMMSFLGLVSGIELKEQKDRIGPIIATGIFYLWLYINIRSNDLFPASFSFFVLGCIIALFTGLVINSFSKISLHTTGISGLLTGLILITSFYTYGYLSKPIRFGDSYYIIHTDLIIIFCILLAGITGTARLYLKAHREEEVYGGYLVGLFAQIIAFAIYF